MKKLYLLATDHAELLFISSIMEWKKLTDAGCKE